MPNASARPKNSGRRSHRRPREDPARNQLVSSSLESAQQCLFNQDYGPAFVHYLLVLNVAPEFKEFAKESFRFTLFKWAEELDSAGRIQDIFSCYEQALELFPADEVILNNVGEQLFRMGFRDEAARHFFKALKLKPDYVEARENFYRVANWLVERWHFLMLNDQGRNRKYQQAIQKAVHGGCTSVLDIGTGTGILGMCAKKAGAAEVYACELSKTMYELACEVVAANGMGGAIKILHKKSLDMEVPKDIPHRVSLVVTETVDAGLFGEGIIESLIHAWRHLLLPPPTGETASGDPSATGRVIPAGATIYAVAVECLEIRRHNKLCVSEVGGLSMAAASERLRSPVSCTADAFEVTEPYTTERLGRLPGGYVQLTEPVTVLQIDFNNVEELEGLSSRMVQRLRVPVVREGKLDALAVWFNLHLDQESSLSTGPHEDTCWEHAIYPEHTSKGFLLKTGDELLVDVSCRETYLHLHSMAVTRNGRHVRLDTAADLRDPEAELCSALACLQTRTDICLLDYSEMALLNNERYHRSFAAALSELVTRLKAEPPTPGEPADPFYVLDVLEGFSMLSLVAAAQGGVRAYSSVEKSRQQEVLKRLARANGVPDDSLEFWVNRDDYQMGALQRPSREKLWSAILLDCVETCGLIRQKLMEKASLARCLLERGGRIFPQKIVVLGTLVESDTLLMESAVQGLDATLGFNIAPFINQFTVPVHVFLELSTLACRRLSEPTELFVLNLMDTNANYDEREVQVLTTSAGRITAVPFWYDIHLDDENIVSTLAPDSHWKQAAVVLQRPLEVAEGEQITLVVKIRNSSISIEVRKDI
ncbi:protein arginine N-methyltransferase 9 [Stigmatopora nigra]